MVAVVIVVESLEVSRCGVYTNFGEVVGVVVVIGGPIQEFGTSAFAVHFKAILGSI